MPDKETQTLKNEQIVRKVTWTGLFINLLLFAIKFSAGTIGNSQAVVADAVHSLSDTATDVAVIIGSYYWGKPADDTHPFGHQRIETLVSIFIGIFLFAAGFVIGWEAVLTMHLKYDGSPGWIALFAAGLSVVVKEALYRWTALTGKRLKSQALAANAWHHRTDAISSIPVLIAVGAAIFSPSWSFLDHVGAIIVSIMILQAATKTVWGGVKELIDVGAPKDICEKIKAIALEDENIKQVHRIRTRYISTSIQADLHIVVDGKINVFDGHKIAEEVKLRLLNTGPDIVDVVVHVEPLESALPEEEC
ncbi:MAG: cation diffusion facilitator family transporter [Desulfobacterales bacterium]|nr:cation diffusion facilitator family transporter [Desulfobacterales bacterium]